jgi:GNAT superfamily N-acetyltransferase
MTKWTADAVQAAADAWVWVPPDAEQVVTSEYQLIAYPAHFQHPTQVAWSKTTRPPVEVIDEVLAQVRAWGRDRVYWWVRADTRPAATEAALLERGAALAETVQVLAYDLAAGLPDLGLPEPGPREPGPPEPGRADGMHAELVSDERTLRLSQLVSAGVWDEHHEPTAAEFESDLARLREALASWSDFRVIVYLDGQPAATGGCGLVSEVARLWGAGTLPAFRGRGAYRQLLSTRIATAHEHGATLALVKGRVQTSAPILLRAGFTAYGEERCYRLPVLADTA